jgi:hypothetical protein
MPSLPQFRLRTALAFIVATALLLASLKTVETVGFFILAVLSGPILVVRRLRQPIRPWKAALVGSLGGAFGGGLGGLVGGTTKNWNAFSISPGNVIDHALAWAIPCSILGWIIGIFAGILAGIVLRDRWTRTTAFGQGSGSNHPTI